MLQELRNSAGTWMVKLLMLLLVASFALWGIDGYIGGSTTQVVAEVGDRKIDANLFRDDFRRQLAMLQRQTGQRIDTEQAKELGLPAQLLQQQIDQLLLESTADRMNLRAPDDLVRALILQNPVFRSAGQFDRLQFENFLAQSGMSEEMYVAALREDLRNQAIAESVAAGAAQPPPTLLQALASYDGERRRVSYLVVPMTGANLGLTADETVLRSFYREHPERFTAPELRALSWIELSPETIAATITVDVGELQAAYAGRLPFLSVPATRSLRQVVVPSQDDAASISTAAAGAASLADAAAGRGYPVELGALSQAELGDLLGEAFAAAVFAAPAPGILPPLESPLGWHVVEVTDATEGTEPSFAEVRERLEADLKQEQAIDRIYGMANQVEDLIAGGSGLREIGETMGLPVRSHPGIDMTGRDIDGRPADVAPEFGALRRVLWRMQSGDEPETHENDIGEGFTVVQMDRVVPTQLRPFEEVQDRVAQAWIESKLAEAAMVRAQQIAQDVAAGQNIQDLARDLSLNLIEAPPIDRNGQGVELPFGADLLQAIFSTQRGEIVTGSSHTGEAVVARIDEILPAIGRADQEALQKQLTDRWSRSFNNDLGTAFRNDLAGRIGVSVNQGILDDI